MNIKKNTNYFTTEDCNLVATLIIDELQKSNPNVLAQIYVTWVGKFFIINGATDSINTFDISEVVNNYFETALDDFHPVNIIDLISYGEGYQKTEPYNTFKKDSFHYSTSDSPLSLDFWFYKDKPYTSDEFYGLSLKSGKSIELLSAKIAHHILSANYANDVKVFVNDDQTIHVSSKSWMVKEDFALNVVDACFGGRIEEELKNMDLINFNFRKLIREEGGYPWMVRDHMKDFTMI